MKPDLVDRPWHLDDNPTGLTELEVSSGMVLGDDSVGSSGFGGGPGPGAGADPLVTLRHLARRVLATPPCVVAFSGGRDSSALLAVLADEARRQGMSPPVAVTSRWDDDEASNETNWQEDVIRAVGVTEWEIIRPGEDLDLLGPEAAATLEQTGLMWPPPAYALQPMIRLARGGVFLSGEGGTRRSGCGLMEPSGLPSGAAGFPVGRTYGRWPWPALRVSTGGGTGSGRCLPIRTGSVRMPSAVWPGLWPMISLATPSGGTGTSSYSRAGGPLPSPNRRSRACAVWPEPASLPPFSTSGS